MSEIVSELEECKAASNQLGRTYWDSLEHNERPAGCYYSNNTNDFYLNLAKPSETENISPQSGAVCKKGTSNIL